MAHPKVEELKTARGKRYVDILLEIWRDRGDEMAAFIQDRRDTTGTVTVLDIGILAIQEDLNLKATFDCLEWSHALYTGTYTMLQRRGMKATQVLDAARAALAQATT
jgi:hypothetical protein